MITVTSCSDRSREDGRANSQRPTTQPAAPPLTPDHSPPLPPSHMKKPAHEIHLQETLAPKNFPAQDVALHPPSRSPVASSSPSDASIELELTDEASSSEGRGTRLTRIPSAIKEYYGLEEEYWDPKLESEFPLPILADSPTLANSYEQNHGSAGGTQPSTSSAREPARPVFLDSRVIVPTTTSVISTSSDVQTICVKDTPSNNISQLATASENDPIVKVAKLQSVVSEDNFEDEDWTPLTPKYMAENQKKLADIKGFAVTEAKVPPPAKAPPSDSLVVDVKESNLSNFKSAATKMPAAPKKTSSDELRNVPASESEDHPTLAPVILSPVPVPLQAPSRTYLSLSKTSNKLLLMIEANGIQLAPIPSAVKSYYGFEEDYWEPRLASVFTLTNEFLTLYYKQNDGSAGGTKSSMSSANEPVRIFFPDEPRKDQQPEADPRVLAPSTAPVSSTSSAAKSKLQKVVSEDNFEDEDWTPMTQETNVPPSAKAPPLDSLVVDVQKPSLSNAQPQSTDLSAASQQSTL